MAEVAVPSAEASVENPAVCAGSDDDCEPQKKKAKVEDPESKKKPKLEDRLTSVLCCAVCLDLPTVAIFQCSNGHLMCSGCLSHLLADARLKDESATCPNCRCEISKSVCIRNLAVEKAVSELPTLCSFCSEMLPRCDLDQHQRELCQERLVTCKYSRIGCPWRGPFHELSQHEELCCHPDKPGRDIMEALQQIDLSHTSQIALYSKIFDLLSFEKISSTDLQLKPYRTDDFITKLFYESSRFSAFNYQWVVKARVNDKHKNPVLTCQRYLTYQLVLKTKIQNPVQVQFIALCGPHGDMKVKPMIYKFDYTCDQAESTFMDLPMDSIECNKQLAARTINMRLIMFQDQK